MWLCFLIAPDFAQLVFNILKRFLSIVCTANCVLDVVIAQSFLDVFDLGPVSDECML